MKYKNITRGTFIYRPNRFVAHVEIDGKTCVCHVKNTGRCKELLLKGATVFLEKSDNTSRKTEYDLVAVYKGEELINIDSQAPNKVFSEWVKKETFFKNISFIKAESKYKNSRFDFYVEADGKKSYIEVKGVTLEKDGILMFPDAPTERGVKHLNELVDAVKNGYDGYIFFISQMQKGRYFVPNKETHPLFAETLKTAAQNGVKVYCMNCKVTKDELCIDDFIEVRFE